MINQKKYKIARQLDKRFFLGIAHRGLHDDKRSENGIQAFQNAIQNNLAFELDVHLSKDGYLMVSHDANLKRMTGKEGIIEDLTRAEIQDNYKLPDGGIIPTLESVLELNNDQVPMVIELKAYRRNGRKVAKACKKIMQGRKRNLYMIISFSPFALLSFGSSFIRSLLISKNHPKMALLAALFESMDAEINLLRNKRIQKYRLKHLVNCFTVETKDCLFETIPLVDQLTFQHIDAKMVNDVLEHKLVELEIN